MVRGQCSVTRGVEMAPGKGAIGKAAEQLRQFRDGCFGNVGEGRFGSVREFAGADSESRELISIIDFIEVTLWRML